MSYQPNTAELEDDLRVDARFEELTKAVLRAVIICKSSRNGGSSQAATWALT